MVSTVHIGALMALSSRAGPLGFWPVMLAILWGQAEPPRPPQPPEARLEVRLADLQRKLESTKAVNVTAQRALQYSRDYWDKAEKARRLGQLFRADRLAEAADALFHIAEHQEHLRTGGGPKGPSALETLPDHLQRVYFRTQQADYFSHQSQSREAAAFPAWARDFYQLALRAYERRDGVASDENAKCAEEVVRALESLAQAATLAAIPPPPKSPVR